MLFDPKDLKKLYIPPSDSSGEDNGQVTIIGGSSLFHGAPLFALKVASRIVDMVFFASPEKSVGRVAEDLKSHLLSFVWVPWEEVEDYIAKSDTVLIGPGFMRFRSEKLSEKERLACDEAGQQTKEITGKLLKAFPKKRWVVDAGSLQAMEASWIPKGAILTPNKKEFNMLFGGISPEVASKRYNCVIVAKGPITVVSSPKETVQIIGGNAGLTKGGTGDVQAGLTAALYAKNDAFLSACAGSFVIKKAGDELYQKVGFNYNADDLVDQIPQTLLKLTK